MKEWIIGIVASAVFLAAFGIMAGYVWGFTIIGRDAVLTLLR